MDALAQSGLIAPDTLPLLLLAAGLLLSVAEAMAPGANFIVVGIALIGAGLSGLLLAPLVGAGVLLTVFMAVATLAFGAGRLLRLQRSSISTAGRGNNRQATATR